MVERQRDEDVALSLAMLPLSANAGLLPGWVINICGSSSKLLPWALLNSGFFKVAWFSCLPPYSLHLLDAFTLFLISFSVLLLSKQIKVKFLLQCEFRIGTDATILKKFSRIYDSDPLPLPAL